MFRACLSLVLALPMVYAGEDLLKPEKIGVSTWVREDLFAGWIANDSAAFERGVQKVNRFLADHPNDATGLAWKYLVVSYGMIQARTKSDDAAYGAGLAQANDLRARIFRGELQDPGPYIIVGSCLVRTANFAPEKNRAAMFREGRSLLAKVPGLQGKDFDTLPAHMRGELWGQIAFAADRLGDTAERDRTLETMRTQLAGSPYEARARSWQKPENLAKEKDYTCMSCHDPGRLAPTLARLNRPAAK